MWWWRDEDMARRLARHLRPNATKSEPAPLNTPVQAVVEERLPAQKEKKGWLWGRRGSSSTFATKTVKADVDVVLGSDDAAQNTGKRIQAQELGGAKMSVAAEEVAFRSENDFGLMESIRGWAVVVAVQVRT
jgi:hypothetical protein